MAPPGEKALGGGSDPEGRRPLQFASLGASCPRAVPTPGPTASTGGGRVWRAKVVELVGPAGAGKSSLLRAIGQRDQSLRPGLRLPKYLHLPTVIALLPTYVALHWPPSTLLWPEMKRVTYLRTLWRTLGREANGVYRTVLLDEGPVYYHARALMHGGQGVSSLGFDRWWRRSLRKWATALDGVVWLDAPDPILTARVRGRPPSRPVDYAVRDMSDSAVAQYLADYRRAYERVLADLAAAGGPRVMRIDTARESIDAIANRLLDNGPLSANGVVRP